MKSINEYLKRYLAGAFFTLVFTASAGADLFYNDDVIVKGSLCVGVDCANGENFNFDTIRLKENNLRIRFIDTSASSSFPTRDWEITANESGNGGKNQFYIQNIDAETKPFIIDDGAPSNSIYVKAGPFIGVGTNTPTMNMHILSGNSPGIRLDQDQSQGFTAQAWDVSGNETNFFIRDVTGGGLLPLRIRAGAPNASLYVDVDGDIGFKTTSPDGIFDIAHPADINNHAVLVSSAGLFGVNVDNGFVPRGQFDVQTTGGKSRFLVTTDGKVGIGMSSANVPAGLFEIEDNAGSSKFIVDNEGDVGIGTAAPVGRFEITNSAGTVPYMAVDAGGNVGLWTKTPTVGVDYTKDNATMLIKDSDTTAASADVRTLLTLNSEYGSNIKFQNRNNASKDWTIGTYSSGNGFLFTRADVSDGNADPYDNYILLFNDGLLSYQNSSGTELMRVQNTGLTINGTFVSASSRTFKENIVSVNPQSVLDTLANLDIAQWNYLADDDKVKHMGPIAEDFFAAFGLGADDKHIATTDASGVALAAIKALNQEVKDKSEKIASLEEQNKQLSDQIKSIEIMVKQLADK